MLPRHGTRRRTRRFDVAFYVPNIGPLLTSAETSPAGGAETQVFLLARALAHAGLSVCVVTFELPGVDIPSSVDSVAVLVRPPYRAHQPLGKLREALSIYRSVANADAEVIVTRGATPDVGLVGLFAKLHRRSFVYSAAGDSDFDIQVVEPKRRNRQLFQLGIRLADTIVVQTAEQVRMCRARFDRSSLLIMSIAEGTPQRVRRPEAFLWIGRVARYKRAFAFVELARALPAGRFWMVAVPDSPDREASELMEALEKEAASVSNLELLAPRPRRDLMALVDQAVAVVSTSDHEGMPNVFLEGWARGVPALALAHDPDGAITRHRLGGFAHGSTERLVELASQLWKTRMEQADVAARCRTYIRQHHSPEAVATRWQELLRALPGPRSSGGAGTHA
jgi:glycosyltransferase involved in cell wall biosynthesis